MRKLTVSELFDWYRESREYRKLSVNSKSAYNNCMNIGILKFKNNGVVDNITQKIVDAWYEDISNTGEVSKALLVMRVMRRIWNLAIKYRFGYVEHNPFMGMGLGNPEPRQIVWDKESLDIAIEGAKEIGVPYLALLLEMCYQTGQRPGDMIALKVKSLNENNNSISFTQQKTGKAMCLPVYEPLKSKLIRAANSSVAHRWGTFLPQYPYNHYSKAFDKVKRVYNLNPELQIRDIRRTVQVELMENGATDAEGQSISGHSDRQMLNTYAPANLRMARNAMERRGFKYE